MGSVVVDSFVIVVAVANAPVVVSSVVKFMFFVDSSVIADVAAAAAIAVVVTVVVAWSWEKKNANAYLKITNFYDLGYDSIMSQISYKNSKS